MLHSLARAGGEGWSGRVVGGSVEKAGDARRPRHSTVKKETSVTMTTTPAL